MLRFNLLNVFWISFKALLSILTATPTSINNKFTLFCLAILFPKLNKAFTSEEPILPVGKNTFMVVFSTCILIIHLLN